MALKNCKECGKEVSESAQTCPHCGISKPAREAHTKDMRIVYALLAIGFVAFVVYLSTDVRWSDDAPKQTTIANEYLEMHHAASINSVTQAKQVLDRLGVISLDLRDNNGWAPLHWAAKNNCPEVARFLIKVGASPRVKVTNKRDRYYGKTPLEIAVAEQNLDVAKALHY